MKYAIGYVEMVVTITALTLTHKFPIIIIIVAVADIQRFTS